MILSQLVSYLQWCSNDEFLVARVKCTEPRTIKLSHKEVQKQHLHQHTFKTWFDCSGILFRHTYMLCKTYGSLCNSNTISRREKNPTNQAHVVLFDAHNLGIVKIWWIKTANRLTAFTRLYGMFLVWKSAILNSGEQQRLFGQTF